MTQAAERTVDAVLRDELAHGDVVLGTIGPILGHLLANQDHSLFSDEIVARIRGMATDLARQILEAQAKAGPEETQTLFGEDRVAQLASQLLCDTDLLSHCHALSLESQLTGRLAARNGLDEVLSPLLQALIASDDAETASTAMAALASQARFVQAQRRMELPLGELPGDIFHRCLLVWRSHLPEEEEGAAKIAEGRLRTGFEEGVSRLGLLSRLVGGMGNGALAALSISHAGVALFLTALALGSGQDRELATLSTNECQLARFALGLRAAGLKPSDIEEQFHFVFPDVTLPRGFGSLRVDQAEDILSTSAGQPGGWSAA